MTITEAIKNLEFHIRLAELTHHRDDLAAAKVGIEALKLYRDMPEHILPTSLKPYADRTEEVKSE